MDHAAQMLRRAAFAGVLVLLFLLHASFALGEVSLSFTPAAPRAGDYVDVVVDTGGEKAKEIRCRLTLDGGKVFSGKMPEIHTAASFRPRKEGMYTLEVTVKLAGNRTEAASVSIPVSGAAPDRYGADVVYSQQDGWWSQHLYTGTYRHTLDSSGCAIFTLSHALQRMGLAGEEILPDRLARVYGGYYTEGLGARTEALITQADLRFGFGTAHAPVTAEDEIISFLRRGDLFTLGIVRHHVVLADAVDVEHRKVHIVDSSPGTTCSRLRPTPAYIRNGDGSWQVIRSAEEIPGIRWFFETSSYGGAGYWLDLEDCAARGLRLIRLPWLTLVSEGEETAVSPDWFGTVRSAVVAGGETAVVSTSSLKWFCDGADGPQLAVVTAPRGASLTDRKGTAVQRYLPIPWGRVLCVLRMDEERVYVCWRGVFGYLKRPEVEPEGMPDGSFPSALVLPEGGSGEAAVRSSMEPGGSGMAAAEWPAGTEVVILDRADGYCLAEGLGCRGWIPEGNLAAAEAGE